MSGKHQLIEEGEEIGQQQVADMHTIHISIGRDDDFIVAQTFEILFDTQSKGQEHQFFIRVDLVAFQSVAVERFSAQGEDRLTVDIAADFKTSGSGVALGEKDHGLFGFGLFGPLVADMIFAVLQFRIAEPGLLLAFS